LYTRIRKVFFYYFPPFFIEHNSHFGARCVSRSVTRLKKGKERREREKKRVASGGVSSFLKEEEEEEALARALGIKGRR
jgi:hypothetical protein